GPCLRAFNKGAVRLCDHIIEHFDGYVDVLFIPLNLEGGGKIRGALPLGGGHPLTDEEELLLVHGKALNVGPIGQVAIDHDRGGPLGGVIGRPSVGQKSLERGGEKTSSTRQYRQQ